MNVKFSIITATYNSEKTLERTIKSVLNQTHKDFEYIIIDGKSTDSTLDILRKYQVEFAEKKIDFKYISENDNGIYDAWNKGIALSKGIWISFLGSDDYYLENALETYSSFIHLDYNYIHSKVRLVDEENKLLKVLGAPLIKDEFFKYMKIAHVGSFHHISLFKDQKFNIKYKSASDYLFFLTIFNNINSLYLDQVTAVMQFGGISTNVKIALKEALLVKIEAKKRNKVLCYYDFFIAYLKYFYRCYFRKI